MRTENRTLHRFLLSLFFASYCATIFANEPESDIRVMSFNLRYGAANDGDNKWDKRKELLAKTIQEYNPDLLGTQETLQFQADFVASNLTGFTYVGKSREPNAKDGEQCGIFFRNERFSDLEQGHFWLSETPEVPGSKSWDSSLPRMVSWVKLYDKRTKGNLYFFNTHFDHRGKVARAESAKLLRSRIDKLSADSVVIITGDFNSGEGSEPYRNLLKSEAPHELLDTYRLAVPERADNERTAHGFQGHQQGSRIDWVVVNSELTVAHASIDRTNIDGRYPSDHYPVTAVLRYKD